jgi:hypothetical protein
VCCAGAFGNRAQRNINNYTDTDKHYLALKTRRKKEQKTVQLVPFELPHNTIKLPQELGAKEGKKRQ